MKSKHPLNPRITSSFLALFLAWVVATVLMPPPYLDPQKNKAASSNASPTGPPRPDSFCSCPSPCPLLTEQPVIFKAHSHMESVFKPLPWEKI